MATIQDVARRAGVSTSTVSRVLNRSEHVRPETVARVQAVIDELGYVPSGLARAMKGKPSDAIALIISDIENPFFAALTRGVEDVAQRQGFSLVLCNADRGKAKQQQYIERVLAGGIRGVIIAPAKNTLTDLKRLIRRGVSLVIVDWRYPLAQADNVYTDSVGGARQLVAHLVGQGHRRIGIITGPHADITAEDRVMGYRLALAEAGLPQDPKLIRFGRFSSESGYRNCARLLALEPRPTAIVACNNRLAAGAYDAMRQAGLEQHRDVCLAGFDRVPFVPSLAASMAVLAQPDYEMGKVAAQLLFERLRDRRGPAERREVILQGQLIVPAAAAVAAPSVAEAAS